METYQVKLFLQGNAQPIVYAALASYETANFFCIVYVDSEGVKRVRKFPVWSIWAVDQEYKYISWKPTAQTASSFEPGRDAGIRWATGEKQDRCHEVGSGV